MMPVIRISDSNAKKLQQLAVPLVDNYDTVIGRLIDAAIAGSPYLLPAGQNLTSPPTPTTAIGDFPVEQHDDLTHTRIRSAIFDGVSISKPNWNDLARYAHKKAYEALGSFDELKKASQAHIREGKYEADGFSYLAEIGISVQGVNSNAAWENTLRIARKLRVPVQIDFEWHNKPKAAHPGEKGTLSWEP